jgi:hypothetical protein
MTETKLSAALPTLDVEIVHRQFPDERAEAITINLKATPSFEAAAGLLPPLLAAQIGSMPFAQPMLFWARCYQAMWQPWLQLAAMPLLIGSDAKKPDMLPGPPR